LTKIFVVFVVLWMILNSQFSIGLFDIVKRSVSWYTQNSIIVLSLIRVVGFEKIFLLCSINTMFSKEIIKCFICILQRELISQHVVIMASSALVREDIICLSYLVEFLVCNVAISFMIFWVPFLGQMFVGLFNIGFTCIPSEAKSSVIVFEVGFLSFLLRHAFFIISIWILSSIYM